jgi:energy-coupling factor transport system ATP-binding protein
MQGTPRSIFSQVDTLRSYRLAVPQVTLLAHELIRRGLPLKEGILDRAEFVQELSGLIRESQDGDGRAFVPDSTNTFDAKAGTHAVKPEDAVLILDHVSHIYNAGMDTEVQALKEVSLTIGQGEFIGLIGHTGSGKSTLIQHLNGLLKASSGAIYFRGQDIDDKDFKKKELRSQVGLVFQYPEHQLFETTVLDDVCFGPKNLGRSPEEAKDAAFDALEKVGLDPSIYDASPFELSGGQKRRVAIAGVLAMEPSVLILDEPTAGLDPKGRDDILGQIRQLHDQKKITVILVSHSMEDVADYVDRIIVMNQGEVMFDDEPKHVFQHQKELEAVGLAVPQVTELMGDLRENGIAVHADITTVEEAAEEIMRLADS